MWCNARELFSDARRAAFELESQRRMLEKLESREGVHGAGFEAIRSSGISDPMAATDARMDHEARIRMSMEDCERTIDYACAVLYGKDYRGRTGGLYVLAEHELADVLCLYYCQAMSWSEVSDIIGYARTPTIERAKRALRLVDEYGFEACIAGIEYADESKGT